MLKINLGLTLLSFNHKNFIAYRRTKGVVIMDFVTVNVIGLRSVIF